MNNLWMLYRYELKKIVGRKRKLAWITLFVCILCIIFTVTDNLITSNAVNGEGADGFYSRFQIDKNYQLALSGRQINQELLDETFAGYQKIPETKEWYTETEEYQLYARPYSAIFQLVRSFTDMNVSDSIHWKPDETAFYAARDSLLESSWQSLRLSDAEKEFWREKETQIQKPMTYFYHEGYFVSITDAFLIVGILTLLFIAVCMSSAFPEEHTQRTDQLILSSAKGKSTVYWAKILAGISVSAAASILMAALTIGLSLGIYGAEGFQAAIQLLHITYSYPLTIGQACLILYGILVITSVLASIFVMVLSELLHSGIAALAISAGGIMAGMVFHIPNRYRIIAQLWDCLPISFLSPWNIFDARLITVFGHRFTSWQTVPMIYIFCSIVIMIVGKYVYQRYQVSGR